MKGQISSWDVFFMVFALVAAIWFLFVWLEDLIDRELPRGWLTLYRLILISGVVTGLHWLSKQVGG